VKNRSFRLRKVFDRLLIILLFCAAIPQVPARAFVQSAPGAQFSTTEAPIKFWNRVIAVQRESLAGAAPQERAKRASQRLAEIPLTASPADITTRSVKVGEEQGVGFLFGGHILFFLGTGDLDKDTGEDLDRVSATTLNNIRAALQARREERSWPVIRNGLLHTFIGLALLLALCIGVWKLQSALVRSFRQKEAAASLKLFRVDILPHIAAAVYGCLRLFAASVSVLLAYAWITDSLRQFPYTEPWADQAGSFVISSLRELAATVLHGLPGLLVVILIYVVTRWVVRIGNVLFDQVATGKLAIVWMDADVAHATQRIFAAIVWIFGIIIAYPYIPGSQTDAFKGLSVFFGLIISLGSTGIINQIMSGLFVVYSRAFRMGEWVKVNEVEGEVLELGLLAAKILTVERQVVTVPNSVLVASSTTNFTRLGHPDGMSISATVTIGYDTPWRQVHALLELAANRTENICKLPKPFVVQRQLSDFYVQYSLIAKLEDEKLRVDTVSNLNSAIQDAFNEFEVQIMSPHFMVQPGTRVVVPPDKWNPPPSSPLIDAPPEPDKSNKLHTGSEPLKHPDRSD
jgi:small-conductance mechanosensitive channel